MDLFDNKLTSKQILFSLLIIIILTLSYVLTINKKVITNKVEVQLGSSTPNLLTKEVGLDLTAKKSVLKLKNGSEAILSKNSLYLDGNILLENIPIKNGLEVSTVGEFYSDSHTCDTGSMINSGDTWDCYSEITGSPNGENFGFIYWRQKSNELGSRAGVLSTFYEFRKDGTLVNNWKLDDSVTYGKKVGSGPLDQKGYILYMDEDSLVVDSSVGTEEGRSMNLRIYKGPGLPYKSIDAWGGGVASFDNRYIALITGTENYSDFLGCGWDSYALGNWEMVSTDDFSRKLIIPKSNSAYTPLTWSDDNNKLLFVEMNFDNEGCTKGYKSLLSYDILLSTSNRFIGQEAKAIFDNYCSTEVENYHCRSGYEFIK
jgi:hypothetical protein